MQLLHAKIKQPTMKRTDGPLLPAVIINSMANVRDAQLPSHNAESPGHNVRLLAEMQALGWVLLTINT